MKTIFFFFAKILVLCLYTAFLAACSQSQVQIENRIVGKASWTEWRDKAGWDIYDAPEYIPDREKVKKLNGFLSDNKYSFVVFATTSCEECIVYLPRLYKIFDTDVSAKRITLIGLGKDLTEPSGTWKKFDIPTTPALFVLKNEVEIGYVSYPDFDWLNGIINILEKDME